MHEQRKNRESQPTFETVFVDENPEVVNALAANFGRRWPAALRFVVGNIFTAESGAIVSPTNCYGDMGAGLDLQLRMWNASLETRLQQHIVSRPSKKLPIGAVVWVETGDSEHPWVIFSPTFRTPSDLASSNRVYRAACAVFGSVRAHNAKAPDRQVRKLLMPGLGTGVGGIDAALATNKIRQAYSHCLSAPVKELEAPVVLRL
jgi:O-acetyl-ADP-ribose deacetylase (regulator of RNase III)